MLNGVDCVQDIGCSCMHACIVVDVSPRCECHIVYLTFSIQYLGRTHGCLQADARERPSILVCGLSQMSAVCCLLSAPLPRGLTSVLRYHCVSFVVAVAAASRSGRMSSCRGIPRSLMASRRSRCRQMPSGCLMLSSVNCKTAQGCCNYSRRYVVIQGQRDGSFQVACLVRDNTWHRVQPIRKYKCVFGLVFSVTLQ